MNTRYSETTKFNRQRRNEEELYPQPVCSEKASDSGGTYLASSARRFHAESIPRQGEATTDSPDQWLLRQNLRALSELQPERVCVRSVCSATSLHALGCFRPRSRASSNARPARGATHRRRCCLIRTWCFNPRTPRGVRPGTSYTVSSSAVVSIHAPRAVCDQ